MSIEICTDSDEIEYHDLLKKILESSGIGIDANEKKLRGLALANGFSTDPIDQVLKIHAKKKIDEKTKWISEGCINIAEDMIKLAEKYSLPTEALQRASIVGKFRDLEFLLGDIYEGGEGITSEFEDKVIEAREKIRKYCFNEDILNSAIEHGKHLAFKKILKRIEKGDEINLKSSIKAAKRLMDEYDFPKEPLIQARKKGYLNVFNKRLEFIKTGDLGFESVARGLAKIFGFPEEQIEESLRIGVRKKYADYLKEIGDGCIIISDIVLEFAKKYGLNERRVEQSVKHYERGEILKLKFYEERYFDENPK